METSSLATEGNSLEWDFSSWTQNKKVGLCSEKAWHTGSLVSSNIFLEMSCPYQFIGTLLRSGDSYSHLRVPLLVHPASILQQKTQGPEQ